MHIRLVLVLLGLPIASAFSTPSSSLTQPRKVPAPPALRSTSSSSDDPPSPSRSRSKFLPSLPAFAKPSDPITVEFLTIAFPAFLQLTAEPLASLVDTIYLGRLSPSSIAGAGISITLWYSLSKIYNDPLLRSSISLVSSSKSDPKKLSTSVSTALYLAAIVGLLQFIVYLLFTPFLLTQMGLTPLSSMYPSASSYITLRSYGSLSATLWLVSNGVYRGLGDTRTPLKWSLIFSMLNIILDPFFMFTCKMGAKGAALGTVVSQYIALVPLLYGLTKKVDIVGLNDKAARSEIIQSLKLYLSSGASILLRTVAKVSCYAYCSRLLAGRGVIESAGYNLTFQLGFAVTQVCEGVGIAVQTMLASDLTNKKRVKKIVNLGLTIGGFVAGSLSLFTYLNRNSVIKSLTTDVAVRAAVQAVFPIVLITQVFKGLAYPSNGIIMGGLDWNYSNLNMWCANFVCFAIVSPMGLGKNNLGGVWMGLAAFMGVQVLGSLARVKSGRGVWRVLKDD
ncbi:hypothetical protein TL16_g08148 [Triparma laevis f. inornata]|uniref:Multidrug and toxic compound extrusion protein n=2 Tax=Triparma laevis TaxID=1534972 RepID=A0A9W7DXF9_9STRA|nr:hypothetical protein TrLO_g2574 [Triparma laevis f. longispina]GMH79443.1 hypothetical protein TL16_g08148 [Triparma laevis f. inornata]